MPAPKAPRPDLSREYEALVRVLPISARDLRHPVGSRLVARVRHLAWWLLLGVAREQGKVVTIRQLAEECHANERYVSNVLRGLVTFEKVPRGGRPRLAALVRLYKAALRGNQVVMIAVDAAAVKALADEAVLFDAAPRAQKRAWAARKKAGASPA